jgi:cell division protein FtsA
LQSIVNSANRAGVEVADAVLESVASAEAALTSDERELGVCLVNIGAHSTDLIVVYEGAVVHTGSIPIGGTHFTNDLAVGLATSVAQAEELKRKYGHAVVTSVPQNAEIEVADPEPHVLRLRTLAEILEPRARELFYYVKENIRHSDLAETLHLEDAMDAIGSGTVLTGGGAMLPGLQDVAESQLRVPSRRGVPVRLTKMPQELVHPAWTTAVGMLLYAHRTRVRRAAENNSLRAKLRAIFAASY